MKTIIPLFCCILLLTVNIACTKEGMPQPKPATTIKLDLKSANIIKSDNQFGFDIFRKVDSESPETK
ncbi:MAG: hypothetical protein Q8859_06180, partial [Bacteroidota bacterium]|nr:hypothetical protein [Bacteroidota bacterium]